MWFMMPDERHQFTIGYDLAFLENDSRNEALKAAKELRTALHDSSELSRNGRTGSFGRKANQSCGCSVCQYELVQKLA